MFLTYRFYFILIVTVVLLAAGLAIPLLFTVGKVLLLLVFLDWLLESVLLYSQKGMEASRIMSKRFSNGDENEVRIRVENNYWFPVKVEVIDEIPVAFQRRDVLFSLSLNKLEGKNILYKLRPVKRGVYSFGKIRVFTSVGLKLVQRRFTLGDDSDVKVYPSYLMLNKYELLAISNNLTDLGIKRIRRAGNQTEFEQIKDYVYGDDYRTINWKATARRNQLMINVYQSERSQHIFNVIDKGRVMQQAFNGMTLLDYAINASLVLSYVAMNKEDKAGLATFSGSFDSFLPASSRPGHLQSILEMLYNQTSNFGESDFSAMSVYFSKLVSKRSLVVLYTNFSNLVSMKRQLPYLIQLSHHHRLLVVFFQDDELKSYLKEQPETTEEYYQHVIAEKMAWEQRLIVSTLRQHGIFSLLTTPENLSIDVINKYLELKSRYNIS